MVSGIWHQNQNQKKEVRNEKMLPGKELLKNTPNPRPQLQSVGITTSAQFAGLTMEDTKDGKKYTMCIVEAEDPGTTGNGTRAYSVCVRTVILPQYKPQEHPPD